MTSLMDDSVSRQLQSPPDDARILIIHPNYPGQHQILERYLHTQSTVYVRFEGFDLTRTHLHEQMKAALSSQSRLDQIAVLILDECDRALPANFDDFLADVMPTIEQGRVVLLTRYVPGYIARNASL